MCRKCINHDASTLLDLEGLCRNYMSILTHNCRVDQHSLTTLAGERLKFLSFNLPTLQPGGPARPHLPKLPRKRLGSCQGGGGTWRPEITDGSYSTCTKTSGPAQGIDVCQPSVPGTNSDVQPKTPISYHNVCFALAQPQLSYLKRLKWL